MAKLPKQWARRGAIIFPILLAIIFIVQLKKSKTEPAQQPPGEQEQAVQVIKIPALTVNPTAVGHGTVRPVAKWDAVAQVSGEVIEKHERLQKGAILESGSHLLRIDPVDYQLSIAQIEADKAAITAQMQELEVRAGNAELSLKIEMDALRLLEKDLVRKRQLAKKGTVSRSSLETQERNLLAQRQKMQSQRSSRDLIPAQRSLLKAQLAQNKARLEVSKRNLKQTDVILPFAGRVSAVHVEHRQYVREGMTLASIDDLSRAEIEVQIPINQVSALINSVPTIDLLKISEKKLRQNLGFKAQVRLREQSLQAQWDARVVRFSDTLDPKTRTLGVIVEVDDPYGSVQPGVRPPLMKGLFVEVVLFGKAQPNSIVIPRSALHEGTVNIVDVDGRLVIRPVVVSFMQPEYAVIKSGLTKGELLVVSDLIPAIEGMLLSSSQSPKVLERLVQQAAAGGVK
jgi:membrane fusion protein, multidrug efflux system